MITLPTPENLVQITWLFIGFMFGRAFGKQLDQEVQNSQWFKNRHPLCQWIIKRCLDFLHHFWIGLLIMIYVCDPCISTIDNEAYWFGYGLFLDDVPDIPKRFIRLIKYFGGE